jgi:DNA polymerase I
MDVEANALHNPTRLWCVVFKDIEKEHYYVFTDHAWVAPSNATRAPLSELDSFWSGVRLVIGHNLLGWDLDTLRHLNHPIPTTIGMLDTLVLSRMIDYPRPGHSIEDYGREFGIDKGKHHDFSRVSDELITYCIRDVDICHKIYGMYRRYCNNPSHARSIRTEHDFQIVVNELSRVGFAYDKRRAENLLRGIEGQLSELDKEIQDEFRPVLVPVKEVTPRLTKYGTLNRSDFRWLGHDDLSEFNGGPFVRCRWQRFNPSSHRQIVDTLTKAGWSPTSRTKAHIDASRSGTVGEDHKRYGWRINEENLNTLPEDAPRPARTLARRILLEARRRTLVEQINLVQEDGRIHGKFYGIGAWTHRMAHQSPNTANIPTGVKMFGERMRSLWRAGRNRLLVGVDAEGIQLRIFAHYINDQEFTNAIVNGSKLTRTDPHSLNQAILGHVCQTRDIAKRYIYALLLGAGMGKLREILGCGDGDAEAAYRNLIGRYSGLAELKQSRIPFDARRGWFVGLDGRRVRIPGETPSERRHLCMSGYLQNGEVVIMKMACLKWWAILKEYDAYLVNFVHDEWQTECPNNMEIALKIAKMQADSLAEVGIELNLNCPLAGSYWSDHHNDYSIGTNWSFTH